MMWIIQDNLFNEDGYCKLVDNLDRLKIPYKIIKVIPFTSDLSPEQQTIPIILPDEIENPIMVCGSITLANIAKQRGWYPGSFHNANHEYSKWRENYGEYLLNYESVIGTFGKITPKWDEFFLRPTEDTKTFNGNEYNHKSLNEFRHKVIEKKQVYSTLTADTPVVASPLKKIYKEFRFYIVDNKIATASLYKLGNQVIYSDVIDELAINFTNQMIKLWEPAKAYVLDVAITENGCKVIEINCFNCSGLYACDTMKYIMAIEDLL